MSESYVLALVGGERIALQAAQVDQVIEIDTLVPVPRAPAFVAGVATLRSRMLTVVDIASAIGVEPGAVARRVAVTADHGGCGYAFLVDSVEAVVTGESELEPLSVKLRERWEQFALGTAVTEAGRALAIDLGRFLNHLPHDIAA